jgi:hypothetical protein
MRVVRAALRRSELRNGPPGESAEVGTSKDPPDCPGALLITQLCHYLNTTVSPNCQEEKAKYRVIYFDVKAT